MLAYHINQYLPFIIKGFNILRKYVKEDYLKKGTKRTKRLKAKKIQTGQKIK